MLPATFDDQRPGIISDSPIITGIPKQQDRVWLVLVVEASPESHILILLYALLMQGEIILRHSIDPFTRRGKANHIDWCERLKYLEKQLVR